MTDVGTIDFSSDLTVSDEVTGQATFPTSGEDHSGEVLRVELVSPAGTVRRIGEGDGAPVGEDAQMSVAFDVPNGLYLVRLVANDGKTLWPSYHETGLTRPDRPEVRVVN